MTRHGNLVAEHQDLDVLGYIGAGEQCQPAEHADEHQGDEMLLLIVKPRLRLVFRSYAAAAAQARA